MADDTLKSSAEPIHQIGSTNYWMACDWNNFHSPSQLVWNSVFPFHNDLWDRLQTGKKLVGRLQETLPVCCKLPVLRTPGTKMASIEPLHLICHRTKITGREFQNQNERSQHKANFRVTVWTLSVQYTEASCGLHFKRKEKHLFLASKVGHINSFQLAQDKFPWLQQWWGRKRNCAWKWQKWMDSTW